MLGSEQMLITFLSSSALLGHVYQLAMENSHLESLLEVIPLAPRIPNLSLAFKKKKGWKNVKCFNYCSVHNSVQSLPGHRLRRSPRPGDSRCPDSPRGLPAPAASSPPEQNPWPPCGPPPRAAAHLFYPTGPPECRAAKFSE